MNHGEKKRKLGPKRLRNELERHHSISLSVSVIHKVLRRNDCKPLAKPPQKKAEYLPPHSRRAGTM
ncbi:MAG: hypothetical protein FWB78_11290 [Treponema sp.]|nr:hypothetical protein [Treponema sp.]